MRSLELLRAVYAVRKAESLNNEQVQQLQDQRLKKLLKHTVANSRFYRRFYREHGINEGDLDEVRVEDLPIIDKNIMMENYDDFVTDPAIKQAGLEAFINESPTPGSKYKKKYSVVHTSGSSGTIGLFVYGPREWEMSKALSLRATGIKLPFGRRKKIAFIAATDGHFASVTSFYNLPRLLFKLLPLSISSPLDEIRDKIDQFQPDVITGYASGLNLLAKEQLAGRIQIDPSEAFCTGDPLTVVFRQRIKKAFGVDPINMYGSSETMTLAGECGQCRGFHLFNDWCSVQVVGDDLLPAKAGRVIITNLYNYTQPLIRYQMNDEIVLSDKACPCGWPFPVIESMAGRQEDFLWFEQEGGEKDFIHPIVLAEFFVPGLEKFQFRQTSPNHLVMRAVVNGDEREVEAAIRGKMEEILSGKSLQSCVRFDVELVDEIGNDVKTGKFRLVVPLGVGEAVGL